MTRLIDVARIRKKAQELLSKNRVRTPPVRVEAIAKSLGVSIRYEPFEDDISGVLYRDRNAVIIGVSSFHHSNRQHFTVAHEIGHLLLHEIDVHVDKGYRMVARDSVSSQAVDPLEMDANRFAAELLMPVEFLEEDLRKLPDDIEEEEAVVRLARKYQVSIQAMTIRLTSLGVLG
jgi:Zn-dependent peptidase ImmA (M78 family)